MKTLFERLLSNVDPKAKVPKGMYLWSDVMIMTWVRQHQKKGKPKKTKPKK